MREFIGNIPTESGFIKRIRFHQGWWRAFVLAEKEGEYYDNRNKEQKKVCNRINNGEKSLSNFLSEEISQVVEKTLTERDQAQSGIMEKNRLFNNLLSSQPLAFNFFGQLKENKELALDFVKTMRPDILEVENVVFEFAPPQSKDHSAFDFGFVVKSSKGRGFIGFECKYTDTFSSKRQETKTFYGDETDKNYKAYWEIFANNRDRFNGEYFTYIRNTNYNQLFRNELLGILLKSEFDFVVTGLFCHHDDKETVKAAIEFKKMIGNSKNDFLLLTYSDYFEKMQKIDLTWEQREYTMLLWARYCGLELSERMNNERK